MFSLAIAHVPLLVLASALAGDHVTPSSGGEAVTPDQAIPGNTAHIDPEVDRILDELENADRGMRDLQAKIVYDRIDATLGDRQYRFGDLLFMDRAPEEAMNRAGMRSFVVRFNRYADLDVVRDLNESWAFDGRWLIERNDDDKTFRRREIARAGQEVDPLRLGEGPLPIPIGQRKADILARYRVALVDPTESLNMPGDAAQEDDVRSYREAVQNTGAIQLKLIPHEKGDGEFDSIRLWYRKATDNPDRWVPLMARAARTNARGREVDVAFVMMVAVQINQGLDEQRMLVPEPGPGEGFAVHVDRLPVEEHIR